MLSLLISCTSPIVAPEDIDSLLSYMYTEMGAEDQEPLLAGANNLYSVIEQNRTGLEAGFAITALSETAVLSTGQSTAYIDDTYGVSMLKQIPFPAEDVAWCYASVDLAEVYNQYIRYDREVLDDVECFLAKNCTTLRYRSTIQSTFPPNVELTTINMVEMQWLETDRGTALLQRSWMEGEAEATAEWANLQAQNYFEFTWSTNTGSDVLAASWAALQLGDAPLPEDTAKTLALGGLESNAEELTAYLEENPSP